MSQRKLQLTSAIADLIDNPPLRAGYPCKMNRILAELNDDDRRALENLVDNTRVSASAVARLLNQHGYDIKHATVAKHRRRADGGGCRCPKGSSL
jgi:hypothetical protein